MHKLDALKYEKPATRKTYPFIIRNFVRANFDKLSELRQLGYSWKQIAQCIQSKYAWRTTISLNTLEKAYSIVKKERIGKK